MGQLMIGEGRVVKGYVKFELFPDKNVYRKMLCISILKIEGTFVAIMHFTVKLSNAPGLI